MSWEAAVSWLSDYFSRWNDMEVEEEESESISAYVEVYIRGHHDVGDRDVSWSGIKWAFKDIRSSPRTWRKT